MVIYFGFRWEPSSLFDEIRSHRPGIATFVSEEVGALEFDVNEDGSFGVTPDQDPLICAKVLGGAAESRACGIIMRTFLAETVMVPHGTDPSRLVRVPVKELRAYQIVRKDVGGDTVLRWRRLAPETVRELYETDPRTGKRIPLTISEIDHRFC